MSERLERLRREIEIERQAALSDLGLTFDGPLLVAGGHDEAMKVINDRLARVPSILRDEASRRMRVAVVCMPWIAGRKVTEQPPNKISEAFGERRTIQDRSEQPPLFKSPV
jgi:hypothetical protein